MRALPEPYGSEYSPGRDTGPPADGGPLADTSTTSGDAGACKLTGTFGSSQCDECMGTTRCCDEANRCLGNEDCMKIVRCVQDGGAPPQCRSRYEAGADEWKKLKGCAAKRDCGVCLGPAESLQ